MSRSRPRVPARLLDYEEWHEGPLIPAPSLERGQRWYLGACAIVRDELDLPEWVAYQFAVGVQHVHIFDNESVIPVVDRLPKWIRLNSTSTGRLTRKCARLRRAPRVVEKTALDRSVITPAV